MKKTLLFALLAVMGMGQAVAQEYEYVPLVREGVKWVCFHDLPSYDNTEDGFCLPAGVHYYTLEIRGEATFNGKQYKAVHLYSGKSIQEEADTVPVYLREENKVVYGILPTGNRYLECPVGIGTYVLYPNMISDLQTNEEFVLYDFCNPESFYNSISPMCCSDYSHTDTVSISGCPRQRHVFNNGVESIIEGIGYDGNGEGTMLNYFYPSTTGVTQVTYHLSHVVEDKKVIYKSRYYNPDINVGIDEVVTDKTRRSLDPNYYNLLGQPVGKEVPTVPGIYIHQRRKICVSRMP